MAVRLTTYFLDGSTILVYYDANGKRIAFKYNGDMYYYVYNLQGDVTHIMKGDKTIVGTYQYDAWGKLLNLNSLTAIAKVNPFRYRGYYYDTESNLYYLNSRYYNPEWGRFINADGLISTGQDILGFNMFAYCSNNPIMFSDPSGTMRELFELLNNLMPVINSLGNVTSKPGTVGNALSVINDFVSGVIDLSLEVGKYLWESSSRPNNIGTGEYRKIVNSKISNLTNVSNGCSKIFNAASYLFMLVESGELAYSEYQIGYTPGKIIWDTAVEVSISAASIYSSIYFGMAVTALFVNPIAGVVVGALGGMAFGYILDLACDDPKNKLKGWVN